MCRDSVYTKVRASDVGWALAHRCPHETTVVFLGSLSPRSEPGCTIKPQRRGGCRGSRSIAFLNRTPSCPESDDGSGRLRWIRRNSAALCDLSVSAVRCAPLHGRIARAHRTVASTKTRRYEALTKTSHVALLTHRRSQSSQSEFTNQISLCLPAEIARPGNPIRTGRFRNAMCDGSTTRCFVGPLWDLRALRVSIAMSAMAEMGQENAMICVIGEIRV